MYKKVNYRQEFYIKIKQDYWFVFNLCFKNIRTCIYANLICRLTTQLYMWDIISHINIELFDLNLSVNVSNYYVMFMI